MCHPFDWCHSVRLPHLPHHYTTEYMLVWLQPISSLALQLQWASHWQRVRYKFTYLLTHFHNDWRQDINLWNNKRAILVIVMTRAGWQSPIHGNREFWHETQILAFSITWNNFSHFLHFCVKIHKLHQIFSSAIQANLAWCIVKTGNGATAWEEIASSA